MSSQTASPSQTYWAKEQKVVASAITLEQRLDLIRNHGDFSVAFSTAVQPRLEYFGDSDGYIAFRRRWGVSFAIGDPVVPKSKLREILGDFISTHRKPSFVHVTEDTAVQLSAMRFRVNEIGTDTNLDLADYDFKGKKKEWLRYADNWVKNHDFSIRETNFDEVTPDQIEQVSEAWRKTRTIKKKEVRFINRPIVLEDEPGVRKWFLFDPAGKMLAFIFFDPLYRDGKIFGVVTCIKRRHPDAPLYAEQALMKRAIDQFKSEGLEVVKLGLSPLANIENKIHRHNKLLHYTSRYYHSAGWVNRYFYNFVGHTKYKKRFRGREEKLYYASPVLFNDLRMICLASLCGFF